MSTCLLWSGRRVASETFSEGIDMSESTCKIRVCVWGKEDAGRIFEGERSGYKCWEVKEKTTS